MKSVVLAGFNWTQLSEIALMIFFVLFVGMIFWVFRKDSNKIYSEIEQLPLKEEGEE